MSKKDKEQEALVSASINSIYQRLLEKRERDRAEYESAKAEEELEKEAAKERTKKEKKKEREEKDQAWRTVVRELTGQDYEYLGKKVKDREYSYKKWYDIETEPIQSPKPKKKHNYSKEFEQELKMLRAAVSQQNKFTEDLNRRFQNALGPASKDAAVPSKTMVELAGAINAGRSNSLGMIREIAAIKKTIADLRMKQEKLDSETSKSSYQSADNSDLGLLGSSVMSSLFDTYPSTSTDVQPLNAQPSDSQPVSVSIEKFDPSSWEGPQLINDFTKYENTPHEVFVEVNDQTGFRRFMAVDTSSGVEISGCNMPTVDPNTLKYDSKNDVIIGALGESYRVRHV